MLDTLCILCQDLQGQVQLDSNDNDTKPKGRFESLVIHCRKQYLEFKESVEARRKQEEQEAEEELQDYESNSDLSLNQRG